MSERRALELESERYATFQQWPSNAPVCVADLVKNGFFATENWLEAECYWCHIRIDTWEYGDQVADRHRRYSPICSMVLAPNHCGNVPLSQSQDQATSETNCNSMVDGGGSQPNLCECGDLLVEANRLKTFKNWPNPNITPQSLAKAGFYYLNRADQVKCAWCNGIIAKWEKNDNAFHEHQRFFPNCPRVQMGPLIEFASKDLEELGIQPTSVPKKPSYACMETRLRTFSQWPIADIQPAEPLAHAGLYYQNINDQVRCFHCNIGLRSWQKEDEPWYEHAKWSPQCQFVLLAKGPNFVRQVRESTAASNATGSSCSTQMQSPQLQQQNMDEIMSQAPAREALALGIDGGVVRNTIQRKLCSFGSAYETLDELLHAIFDEPGTDAALELTERTIQEPTAPLALDCCATTSKAAAAAAAQPTSPTEPSKPAATSTDAANSIVMPRAVAPNANISLEEENRQLKDARLCKVCLDEEVGVVFLPCGHLATCNQCAGATVNCPMCRAEIKGLVRTFIS